LNEQISIPNAHEPNSFLEPFGQTNLLLSQETSIVGPSSSGETASNNGTELLADAGNSTAPRFIDDCDVEIESDDEPTPDRIALIREAISRGVPLSKVEDYLDWLDNL